MFRACAGPFGAGVRELTFTVASATERDEIVQRFGDLVAAAQRAQANAEEAAPEAELPPPASPALELIMADEPETPGTVEF